MKLILTSLIIVLVAVTAPAQRQAKRLVSCYVREIQHDVSPEAAVMINDTVVVHVACRNHPRLEIPQHKWPEEWGVPEIGKRVGFIDYGDGKRWLPLTTKK